MLTLSASLNAQNQQQINALFAQGDVINWAFQLKIATVPLNLTDYRIKMTIDFETPLQLSTDNGSVVITNATNGQFQINISSSDTAIFEPGTYDYDLWLEPTLSPPTETQYLTGSVTVNKSVSAFP